jgi:hypothetical protein
MLRGCASLLSLLAIACGGSSSETPFPLEPDRRETKGAARREVVFSGAEGDAGAEESGRMERRARASTCGAAGSKPGAAPEPEAEPSGPSLSRVINDRRR